MKRILVVSIALVLAAFLIPMLAVGQAPLKDLYAATPSPSNPPGAPPQASPPSGEGQGGVGDESPPEWNTSDAAVTMLVKTGDTAEQITLRELLYGVVAAEMPALYPEEALKAQAVAARTFILKMSAEHAHSDADICGDPAHCLAYRPLAVTAADWGEESGGLMDKIRAAVDGTDGQVLTYEGELIEAVFFAVSSGRTENAADVWGEDVPYLRAVDSSWDRESPAYESTVTFTAGEAGEIVTKAHPEAALSGTPGDWFGPLERSASGGVLRVEVGGVFLSGAEIRSLFGLSSHNFNVYGSPGAVTFTVYGYGHGVGMSQFGARQLALMSDMGYEEILKWYYTGVQLAKMGSVDK